MAAEYGDAYYQWAERKSSRESFEKVPLSFLKIAYGGLHDLDLNLAVAKVSAPPAELAVESSAAGSR